MNREGYNLRADSVTWNRRSGEVHANGDVRVVSPGGDVAYADSVQLEDTLKDGIVQNMLLVLADGGRLAATEATRRNGVYDLDHAAYTPCAVTTPEGCPKDPTWQINAVRVVHDPVRHRISYQGATLNLFGMPLLGLPGLSHPDGSQGGGTGFLVPEIRYSRRNGVAISAPYYLRFSSNRDLTVTPHVYTGVLPMLEAEYRQLTSLGAFDVHGYLTYGSRLQLDPLAPPGRQRGQGDQGLYRGQRPADPEPDLDASPPRAATRPTAPSCAATTSRTTIGCARWSTPSGSPPIATSRSPAGRSKGCASPTSPARSRSPCRRSTRAGGSPTRSSAAASSSRPTASPCPPGRPGHAARLRQRDLAAARHHPARPGAGADRLMRAATSITPATRC